MAAPVAPAIRVDEMFECAGDVCHDDAVNFEVCMPCEPMELAYPAADPSDSVVEVEREHPLDVSIVLSSTPSEDIVCTLPVADLFLRCDVRFNSPFQAWHFRDKSTIIVGIAVLMLRIASFQISSCCYGLAVLLVHFSDRLLASIRAPARLIPPPLVRPPVRPSARPPARSSARPRVRLLVRPSVRSRVRSSARAHCVEPNR